MALHPSNQTEELGNSFANNTTQSDGYEELVSVVEWISVYYCLFLIGAGCLNNTLSFIVFSRRAFRGSTTSVYFRFLSLMDLGSILTGLTRFFQISALDLDVRRELRSCHWNLWWAMMFLQCSSWTLLAATTERVVSIVWPHRVRIICSRNTAVLVIAIIVLTIGLVNSPIFFIFGTLRVVNLLPNQSFVRTCVVVYPPREMSNLVWYIFDEVLLAFLPGLLLAIFNIIIITRVNRSRAKVKSTTSKEQITKEREISSQVPGGSSLDLVANNNNPRGNKSLTASNRANCNPESGEKTNDTSVSIKSIRFKSLSSSRVTGSKKETSLTLTLMSVNVAFIVCNFPICIYELGPHYQTSTGLGRLGDAISHLLLINMYSNNALNFLLYCLSGSRFRRELKALTLLIFSFGRK